MINKNTDGQLKKWYDLSGDASEKLSLDSILFSLGFASDYDFKIFVEKHEINDIFIDWVKREIRFIHGPLIWKIKPSPLSYKINRYMYTVDLKGSNQIRPITSSNSYLQWLDTRMADMHEFTCNVKTDMFKSEYFDRNYKYTKTTVNLTLIRSLSLLTVYFLIFFSFGLTVIDKNYFILVVILLIPGTCLVLGIGEIADQKDIYNNATLLFKCLNTPVTIDTLEDLISEQKRLVEIKRNYFKFGRNHFVIFYICEKKVAYKLLARTEFNNILRPAIYSAVGYFFLRRSLVIPIVIDISTGEEYVPNIVMTVKQERLLRDLSKDLL